MKQERGFTLVEMVIAVAVSGLIITFLSAMISQSISVYNIALENNEGMAKIVPVIKRIEQDLSEAGGNITAVSEISNTSFAGLRIAGSFGVHSYFWDSNGDGEWNATEGAGAADTAKAIYRVSGSAVDVLMSSPGNIPAAVSKYGTVWSGQYIAIKSFYFTFYRENPEGSGRHVIWDSGVSTPGAIKYVMIHADIEGVREKTTFRFNTGIKIKD